VRRLDDEPRKAGAAPATVDESSARPNATAAQLDGLWEGVAAAISEEPSEIGS
jgi:hypothetical protein